MAKLTGKQIKENRNKWTQALISGMYKQGKGLLKKTVKGEPRYCCLGVLCEINKDRLTEEVTDRVSSFTLNYEPASYGSNTEPPTEITKLVGLDSSQVGVLMQLNDIEKLDFSTISTVIETMEIRR